MNNRDLAKEFRKLAREQELEHTNEFGYKRSKVWGGTKSNKQRRRDEKRKLNQIRNSDDYDNYLE